MGQSVPAKLAIARRAAALFAPGESLFIDTGSTTLYFAEALAQAEGLTVITNSSAIARTLSPPGSPHRVVLIGGDYHHDNQETVGVLAVSQIRGFRTRHAVLTIGAIAEGGAVMDFSIEEAEVARAMVSQSEEVTILADVSKLERTALCEVCRLDQVRRLVCDGPPPISVSRAMGGGRCGTRSGVAAALLVVMQLLGSCPSATTRLGRFGSVESIGGGRIAGLRPLQPPLSPRPRTPGRLVSSHLH